MKNNKTLPIVSANVAKLYSAKKFAECKTIDEMRTFINNMSAEVGSNVTVQNGIHKDDKVSAVHYKGAQFTIKNDVKLILIAESESFWLKDGIAKVVSVNNRNVTNRSNHYNAMKLEALERLASEELGKTEKALYRNNLNTAETELTKLKNATLNIKEYKAAIETSPLFKDVQKVEDACNLAHESYEKAWDALFGYPMPADFAAYIGKREDIHTVVTEGTGQGARVVEFVGYPDYFRAHVAQAAMDMKVFTPKWFRIARNKSESK